MTRASGRSVVDFWVLAPALRSVAWLVAAAVRWPAVCSVAPSARLEARRQRHNLRRRDIIAARIIRPLRHRIVRIEAG